MSNAPSPTRTALTSLAFCALATTAAHARPTCRELAEATPMPAGEARLWAETIWSSVRATDERLGGVASIASIHWINGWPDGRVEPAGAWYCPGGDAVFVSAALVDYAWQGRRVDGASFLGFVLAHELAHRRFEPSGPGSVAEGSACEDIPLSEVRADARAAFLIALSPDPATGRALSPFQLVRRDSLAGFFAGERGWPVDCKAWSARADAVAASVARMHVLGRIYDTAIALALADALPEQLPEILEAVDEAVNGTSDPWSVVPELKLTRALVHLSRAGTTSCPEALARAPLSPSACSLRCRPVAPAHALLSPFDALGTRAGLAPRRDEELALVRRLLDAAIRLGAKPEEVLGIEVCEAFVAGDPRRRDETLARLAGTMSGSSVGPGRRADLDGLVAAARLQAFLGEEPSPIGSPAWLDALRELRHDGGIGDGTEAGRLASTWLGERAPAIARVDGPIDAPQLDAWVRAEPCAPKAVLPIKDGWRLATSDNCAVISRGAVQVLRLFEVTPTALSESIASWSRYCTLEDRGSDDAGDRVTKAVCPAWDGPASGWLLSFRGARWTRGVRLAP